jgi:hypothetical protein
MLNWEIKWFGKSYAAKPIIDRMKSEGINFEALENQRKLDEANWIALRNIAKDAEDLRLAWISHDKIRTTIEEKYVWWDRANWDRANSANINWLIDICLGKKER